MSDLTVAVDIDGCCADFQHGWMNKYMEWFPGRLVGDPVDVYKSWNALIDNTHFSQVDDFWRWTDDSRLWSDLPVIPGAQGAIWELKDRIDFKFVTSRHKLAEPFTWVWLSKNFPFIPAAQLHLRDSISKHMVSADVYVDDSPVTLKSLKEQNKLAIRFVQPWNARCPGLKAEGWSDVSSILKEMIS